MPGANGCASFCPCLVLARVLVKSRPAADNALSEKVENIGWLLSLLVWRHRALASNNRGGGRRLRRLAEAARVASMSCNAFRGSRHEMPIWQAATGMPSARGTAASPVHEKHPAPISAPPANRARVIVRENRRVGLPYRLPARHVGAACRRPESASIGGSASATAA